MTPTLPQPPFTIPPAVVDETAPRTVPIRREDAGLSRIFGPVARRLLEYGASVNWQCTIAEAADACGMADKSARNAARFAGFAHRFAGFNAKKSLAGTDRERERGNYSGQLSQLRRGHDFDPNRIPVDLLMR
jgi:hypothetical protein